jgi:hypothetical protein
MYKVEETSYITLDRTTTILRHNVFGVKLELSGKHGMFEKHIAYFVNESDAIDFCTIKNKSIAYKEVLLSGQVYHSESLCY